MTNANRPTEILPDPAPFWMFFIPNFVGLAFVAALERCGLEQLIASLFSPNVHPFAMLGLGIFAIFNANSYLAGSVVCARVEYGVKLPNLYADKKENKNSVLFNCIQRGHQNFIENLAGYVLSALFTAMIADRPNTAGFMLIIVSIGRCLYAQGYKKNVTSRILGVLLAQFAGTSVGIGYGIVIAASAVGVGPYCAD